jgi:hypothetical protein
MAIVRAVFRSVENLAVRLALGAAIFAWPAPAHSDAPTTCAPPPASTVTVDVKDRRAKGDGQTDDTASIQTAIDEVKGTKGTVLVPQGVYMIDAVKKRLKLRDDMTLKLAEGAVLKAIPNDAEKYSILTIDRASNVWVIGGSLEGDRDQHMGKAGQWGHGIRIGKGAKNVTVSNVTSKKMWGDGFYVQDAEDVRFCDVMADGNRRQGLSVIQVDGLLVLNSVFKNTHGTRPSAGIDFEPDRVEQKITNVRIVGSKFIDNAGPILVAGKKARYQDRDDAQHLPQQSRRGRICSLPRRGDLRQPRDKHRHRAHCRLQCLCRAGRNGGAPERLRQRRLCGGPAEEAQEAARRVDLLRPSLRPPAAAPPPA